MPPSSSHLARSKAAWPPESGTVSSGYEPRTSWRDRGEFPPVWRQGFSLYILLWIFNGVYYTAPFPPRRPGFIARSVTSRPSVGVKHPPHATHTENAIIPADALPLVATGHDVVSCSGEFNAQRSGQARQENISPGTSQDNYRSDNYRSERSSRRSCSRSLDFVPAASSAREHRSE